MLQTVREKGFWARPTETITACSDSDDNIFLECAHAGCADYLVTGNLKHFPPSWGTTLIVAPRRFRTSSGWKLSQHMNRFRVSATIFACPLAIPATTAIPESLTVPPRAIRLHNRFRARFSDISLARVSWEIGGLAAVCYCFQ